MRKLTALHLSNNYNFFLENGVQINLKQEANEIL